MKLQVERGDFNTLKIADEESEIALRKLKYGVVYDVEIKASRNPKFHRKFFKLIYTGFQNTKSKITNIELYRYYVTMKAGFYVSVKTGTGTMILPKSISFAKMDETEFKKLYNAVFDQIIIDTEADEELFRKELERFMSH